MKEPSKNKIKLITKENLKKSKTKLESMIERIMRHVKRIQGSLTKITQEQKETEKAYIQELKEKQSELAEVNSQLEKFIFPIEIQNKGKLGQDSNCILTGDEMEGNDDEKFNRSQAKRSIQNEVKNSSTDDKDSGYIEEPKIVCHESRQAFIPNRLQSLGISCQSKIPEQKNIGISTQDFLKKMLDYLDLDTDTVSKKSNSNIKIGLRPLAKFSSSFAQKKLRRHTNMIRKLPSLKRNKLTQEIRDNFFKEEPELFPTCVLLNSYLAEKKNYVLGIEEMLMIYAESYGNLNTFKEKILSDSEMARLFGKQRF